jgi:hypothetical protein
MAEFKAFSFFIDNKNKNSEGGSSQNSQQSGIQDPINALQNLATQGTRNIQPQMMNQQTQQSQQQISSMMHVQSQQQTAMGQQSQNMIRPMINQQIGQNQVIQPQISQMINQNSANVKYKFGVDYEPDGLKWKSTRYDF